MFWVNFFPFHELQKEIRQSEMWCPARARPPHGFELLPVPATPWGSQTKPLEVGSREKHSFTHLAHQEADLQVCTWHNFRVFSLGQPLWITSFWAGSSQAWIPPRWERGAEKAFSQKSHHQFALTQHARLLQPNPSYPFSFYISLIGWGGFLGLLF